MDEVIASDRGKPGPLSLPSRILLTALTIVLTAIGLLGLLLPVIPGILLLALAAMVAARCSRRLRIWLHRRHYGQRLLAWQQRLEGLSGSDYIRLTFLTLARSLLQGLDWLQQWIWKQRRNRP